MDKVDNVEKREVHIILIFKMAEIKSFMFQAGNVDKEQKIHIKNAVYAQFNVDNVDN